MKLVIVTVFDRAAGAFGRPVFAPSEGVALRSFRDEVNRVQDGNQMNLHPADFDVFVLGSWEDQGAVFELFDRPKMLVNGSSCIEVAAVLQRQG